MALLLVPLPLLAQATPGSVEVGYGVGRFIGGTLAKGSNEAFDYKVDVDNDPTGGFWLAAQLTPEWGVELEYRRTTTHVIGYKGGVFASQQELAGLAVASFEALAVRSFRSGSFIPYVGAGVGLVNLDIDMPDRSYRDSNRGALALTAGARFSSPGGPGSASICADAPPTLASDASVRITAGPTPGAGSPTPN